MSAEHLGIGMGRAKYSKLIFLHQDVQWSRQEGNIHYPVKKRTLDVFELRILGNCHIEGAQIDRQ